MNFIRYCFTLLIFSSYFNVNAMEYNDLPCPYVDLGPIDIDFDFSFLRGLLPNMYIIIESPHLIFLNREGLKNCLDENIRKQWRTAEIIDETSAKIKALLLLTKEELECFVSKNSYLKNKDYSIGIIQKWAEAAVKYLIESRLCEFSISKNLISSYIESEIEEIEKRIS